MIYISKISFRESYRNLPADLVIEPRALNLLVGEQGSGKSSLLELMHEHGTRKGKKSVLGIELTPETIQKGVTTYYFDSEKHNPRMKDPSHYTNVDGTNRGIGYVSALTSRFVSHGELLKQFTVDGLVRAKDSIVFIDEPESGLSIRNQYKLVASVNEAVYNGCQLFIATHCLPLIESCEHVYSMEHRCWIESGAFIETQKGEAHD